MKKKVCFLLIFALYFFIANSVFATSNEEQYEIEFNYPDEKCTISSKFIYVSSEQKITKATSYACCKSNKCELVNFDTYNLKPFNIADSTEIMTLNYLKSRLLDKSLSPNFYSVDNGFSSCEYLGYQTKLKNSYVSIGTSMFESVDSYLPENSQKVAKTIIKGGKSLGYIKKFGMGDFAIGVSCDIVVDEEAKSFEKLALCHNYLQNIQNNNGYYGLSEDLNNCNQEVLIQVKHTLERIDVQIKGAVDLVFSLIKGVWNFFVGFFDALEKNDLENVPELTIEKTRLDILTEMKNKLEKNDVDFRYRDSESLAQKSLYRISQRKESVDKKLNDSEYNFRHIDKKSSLSVFFINLFYEPNCDNTNINKYYNLTKKELELGRILVKNYQFNSADITFENFNLYINQTNYYINQQNNIDRKLDYSNILFFVCIGIMIFIFLYIFFKK